MQLSPCLFPLCVSVCVCETEFILANTHVQTSLTEEQLKSGEMNQMLKESEQIEREKEMVCASGKSAECSCVISALNLMRKRTQTSIHNEISLSCQCV